MSAGAESEHDVAVIVLTGGPGGGKSTLLNRCAVESALAQRIGVFEEAIRAMRGSGLEPRSKAFQCAMVATQIAAEDALKSTMADRRKQALITHRGWGDSAARPLRR
jgi:predicted ATPase